MKGHATIEGKPPVTHPVVVLPSTLAIVFAFLLAVIGNAAQAQQLVHGELLFVAPDIYSPRSEENRAPNHKLADQYYEQSRQACEQGNISEALQMATRAVREDPNHADARRVLGYRRVGSHWAGSYAARRIDRGEIWHQEFGWIRTEELPRWQAGKRPQGKRWIDAEEDARRHAEIGNGWQLRTDHFLVTTNHSLQAAAEFATRLEQLYQIWRQMFGGFYLEKESLLPRFDGEEISGYRSRPFRVTYHRSRDQYNSLLVHKQPRIAISLGIYLASDRTSHFFAGPDQDAGTIYHEAVHQFFQESTPAARSVAGLSNAWLVEGIACYFESLAQHDDPQVGHFYSLGTPSAGRLPAAVHRRLVDGYYLPLQELSALGTSDLLRRSDIVRLYSQSAGMATFLVHGQDGAYRPALVRLLKLIYKGRDKADSLEKVTGRTFAELDAEYLKFLRSVSE